ncbi:hypothetical protein D9613_012727 [Agrocybe pediades]|uniref:Uncharacterized protein n=1 Tax=Agrocybe pediades TaxID=84607 RepID=A0A8H4QKV0_9AGAR|nr:hypothetical protein D9613_012727 [Agrocybe pediades]
MPAKPPPAAHETGKRKRVASEKATTNGDPLLTSKHPKVTHNTTVTVPEATQPTTSQSSTQPKASQGSTQPKVSQDSRTNQSKSQRASVEDVEDDDEDDIPVPKKAAPKNKSRILESDDDKIVEIDAPSARASSPDSVVEIEDPEEETPEKELVCRFLDKGDAKSTSNLKHHAIRCWGETLVEQAMKTANVESIREGLKDAKLVDGSITVVFKRNGKGKITYSHRQHTASQTRAEIVRWVSESMRPFNIVEVPQCLLLDIAKVARSHTGLNLAITFAKILEDFGIEDKILSLTCDNASSNDALISQLPTLLDAFPGAANRTWCFTHILNLVAKVILRQFDTLKGKADDAIDDAADALAGLENEIDRDLEEELELAGEIELEEQEMERDAASDEDEDDDETGMVDYRKEMTPDEIAELDATLRKIAYAVKNSTTILLPEWNAIIKRLSIASKAAKQKPLSQRVMPRDVTTRWNSTFDMLVFALEYQQVINKITASRDFKMRKYELQSDDGLPYPARALLASRRAPPPSTASRSSLPPALHLASHPLTSALASHALSHLAPSLVPPSRLTAPLLTPSSPPDPLLTSGTPPDPRLSPPSHYAAPSHSPSPCLLAPPSLSLSLPFSSCRPSPPMCWCPPSSAHPAGRLAFHLASFVLLTLRWCSTADVVVVFGGRHRRRGRWWSVEMVPVGARRGYGSGGAGGGEGKGAGGGEGGRRWLGMAVLREPWWW